MLRPIGCFASTLLAILVALGVTETLKHVSSLERAIVLSAAVLAAAAVAFLRERFLDRPRTEPQRAADAILATRRQAILFRQIVPPNHDRRHLSFFGGAPIAPAGFQWPDAVARDGTAKPLSFLLQVDCGAIPTVGRLGLMPQQGVLYVFLAPKGDAFRVLHEGDVADDWVELSPPETLGPIHDAPLTWKRPHSDADSPRIWPKWAFDPVLVSAPPPRDAHALEESYSWPGTIDLARAIRAIPGAIVPLRRVRGEDRESGGALARPFETFPQDWGAIRITTGLIAERMNRDVAQARRLVFKNMSEDDFAALVEAVSSERREWEERASAAAFFDEVPQNERDRFWDWITAREWLTRQAIEDAATLSIEASLTHGPDAASGIPADAVDRIRHRHALGVEAEGSLHINTPDRMLAAPVDVQGDIEDRAREYLLLLELSSNEGLAHHFGEGVFQFWIRPADLGARRFDRVELSTTAY